MHLGRWTILAIMGIVAACAPTIGPVTPPVEVLVVLDSLDDSLRIIPVDSPGVVHTIELQPQSGTVVNALALRGSMAAIGFSDQVEVLDLGNGHQPICGPSSLGEGLISALAFGGGDSAYAATAASNRVSFFATLQSASCSGQYQQYSGAPQGLSLARGSVFVVVGNGPGPGPCVPGPQVVCPSWVSSYGAPDSIPLAGPGNARAAIFASDGFLYVVSAGSDGTANGTLSQIDPLQKSGVGGPTYPGFGHLPSYLATNDADRIYVTSPVDSGLMVFNVRTHQIERGYTNAVALGGHSRGVATDDLGRLYVLLAGSCNASGSRGTVHVLGSDLVATHDIPVGRCPIAIGVTEIPSIAYKFSD
ncbi:MAG TPA: hypothetical protein VGM77_13470 [Gemmatimonadales bacterium]|jgi:hypothetical protein